MKKILLLSIILLSVMMTACKPDPINNEGDDNNNTIQEEEPIVKKYLVREYIIDKNKPIFIIDWNDDFTRIEHITTDSGTYNQVEYDFYYYAEDSIKVSVYSPGHTSKTNYICRMKDGKIAQIDFYYKDEYKHSVYREYDEKGRILIESNNTNNLEKRFIWHDENLYMTYVYPQGDTTVYGDFGEHIHPYYTQPHWLRGYSGSGGYGQEYITQPFWKNFGTCSERGCYEHDEDGYVTYSYHITENGDCQPFRHYEYDY